MLLDPIRGIYEGRSTLGIGDASAKLSGALRVLRAQLKLGLDRSDLRIDEADAVIKKTVRVDEVC